MGASQTFTGFGAPSSGMAGGLPSATAKAKTQAEIDAENLWKQQGTNIGTDVGAAGAGKAKTASAADEAFTELNSLSDKNVSGWSPSNTQAANANNVAQWLSSLASLRPSSAGPSASVGGLEAPAAAGGAGGPSALRGFSTSALDTFDPSAAESSYITGAQDKFNANLTSRLDTLQNKSVGAGRLRTGFYDRDQGSVATQLGKDYNADIAQEAGVFSGQRLSAMTSAAQLREAAAAGIDSNALTAAGQANSVASANADRALRGSEDANSFALSRAQMGLTGAEYADTSAISRAEYEDSNLFDRAKYLDTSATGRATTGLEAALGRESRYMSDYDTQTGRQDAYTSATRDWAASDRQTADARDAAARARAAAGGGPPLTKTRLGSPSRSGIPGVVDYYPGG